MTRLSSLRRLAGEPGLLLVLIAFALAGAIVRVLDLGPAALQNAAHFATGAFTVVLVLAGLGALGSWRGDGEQRPLRRATTPLTASRIATVLFVVVLSGVDMQEAAAAGIAFLVILLSPNDDSPNTAPAAATPSGEPTRYLALLADSQGGDRLIALQAHGPDDALAQARAVEPDGLERLSVVALCPAAVADRVITESGESLGERAARERMDEADRPVIDTHA